MPKFYFKFCSSICNDNIFGLFFLRENPSNVNTKPERVDWVKLKTHFWLLLSSSYRVSSIRKLCYSLFNHLISIQMIKNLNFHFPGQNWTKIGLAKITEVSKNGNFLVCHVYKVRRSTNFSLSLFIYPFWDGIAPWNSHVEFFTLVVHSSSESTSLYSKALLCILATTAIPATWFSLWYPRILSLKFLYSEKATKFCEIFP